MGLDTFFLKKKDILDYLVLVDFSENAAVENKHVSSKQWTSTFISNPALVCANINQDNN